MDNISLIKPETEKLAFVYTTRGEEDTSLPKLLKQFEVWKSCDAGSKDQFIIVFNSCTEDFVEKTIEAHPLICPIDNDMNIEGVPVSLNRGLRYAHLKGWNAYIMQPGAESQDGVLLNSGVHLEKFGQYIPMKMMDAIGYLSPNFHLSHYWLDYLLRFQVYLDQHEDLAGKLSLVISPELLEQELSSTSEWDILKFGAMWNVPTTVAPKEFWEYASKQRWAWVESMRVV